MTTTTTVLFWTAMASLGFGVVGGWYPLWKSATLSPDAVQRRVYWSGLTMALALLFVSNIPNWRDASIITVAMALGLIATTFYCTNHIRIRGRVYTAFPSRRKADRPPAHARDSSDD